MISVWTGSRNFIADWWWWWHLSYSRECLCQLGNDLVAVCVCDVTVCASLLFCDGQTDNKDGNIPVGSSDRNLLNNALYTWSPVVGWLSIVPPPPPQTANHPTEFRPPLIK